MQEVSIQKNTHTVAAQMSKCTNEVPKLITSKDQIICEYPDVFEGIETLPRTILLHPN